MDGVIIDSEPMHARAAILAAKKYNINITVDYCYGFIGSTTYYMCQKMIEEFNINATPEELLQANIEMKKYLLDTEGYPAIPYVIDLIKDLHSHGMKLIIASSSPSDDIEYVMEALHIKKYFDGYVSGMSVAHPKPAPDIFLAAAERLRVKPEEAVVIEDSANGSNSAYAAGIPCIGFINPNSGKQDLSKAAMLVEGFEEVDFNFIENVYRQVHWEPSIILSTDRLVIKELTEEDMNELFLLYRDPEIMEFIDDISNTLEIEKEKHRAYIRYAYQYYGFGLWGIFLKESMQLIGRCGVELKSVEGKEEYEIGYLIGKKYQGNGYARECTEAILQYFFQHYDVNRIIAVIDQKNTRSINLVQKLEMIRTGELIRNHRKCYKYIINRK